MYFVTAKPFTLKDKYNQVSGSYNRGAAEMQSISSDPL